MSNIPKNLVYIVVVTLAIIIIALGYKTLKQQPVPLSVKPANQNKVATQTAQQSSKQSTASATIASNHPNLVQKPQTLDKAIMYAINGEVDQFNGGQLILKSKGDPLPDFTVPKNVTVVKALDSTKSEPSSLASIKNGSMITIIVMFDQTAKTYTVTHITIL